MHALVNGSDVSPSFPVCLEVRIRKVTRADLRNLEWYGLYTPHRAIIRSAYRRQQRGTNLMLMADANGFPVGQVWIDLARKRSEATGFLWAVRVYPFLEGFGIGTRLMEAAEKALRQGGFTAAELGVEKTSKAGRFYERLGYRRVGQLSEKARYRRPDGKRVCMNVDEWLYRKQLGPEAGPRNGKAHGTLRSRK